MCKCTKPISTLPRIATLPRSPAARITLSAPRWKSSKRHNAREAIPHPTFPPLPRTSSAALLIRHRHTALGVIRRRQIDESDLYVFPFCSAHFDQCLRHSLGKLPLLFRRSSGHPCDLHVRHESSLEELKRMNREDFTGSSQRRETRGGPCKFAPSMGATQSPAARNHFQPA